MGTVIIFYKYVDIEYPKQILKWQFKVCKDLGLTGRVIIAHEGINATLAGDTLQIDRYISLMNNHPLFTQIDFKKSPGDSSYFPRLRIVVKNEIVHMGIDSKVITAKNAGTALTPQQVHALLENKPENLVILDARNSYESKIGTFKQAITPEIEHFRQLPTYIDNNLEQFKDKQVLMFCTAGVRCERASAYLKEKGVAQEVYQVQGGIQRYVEEYPEGFFRGTNYVFDGRVTVKVNDDILSTCELCPTPCAEYANCRNANCNHHFICCPACKIRLKDACSELCLQLLEEKKVKPRPPMQKIVLSEVKS